MGITNGTCSYKYSHCFLRAWCPVEGDVDAYNYLQGVEAFTVYSKVNVQFPKYGILRSNENGKLTENYNLFTIQYMLEKSGNSFEDLQEDGAVIVVTVDWDCNLDHSADECQPEFKFTRIDETTNFSPGYNWRYAHNYWLPNPNDTTSPIPGRTEYRDLFKVYGIRFLYLITGKGGKFDIVPLLVNLGSGLALLGIATVVSDFITLHILPARKYYHLAKFEELEDEVKSLLGREVNSGRK